jgi:hypothetical protein
MFPLHIGLSPGYTGYMSNNKAILHTTSKLDLEQLELSLAGAHESAQHSFCTLFGHPFTEN